MPPSPDAVPILIADDDQGYVHFLRRILADAKGQQFDVEHVTHLSRILPILKAHKAAVLLLDIHLPDGNGLEWLAAHRAEVDAAVVVMTGHIEFDVAEDIAPGAQDFLLKNQVDRYQLVRAILYAAERHRTQQQLIRSREYFQSLIENARDLITVVDERGWILYQSPASAYVLGMAPEEIVHRHLWDLVSIDDVPRMRALLAAAFEGNVDKAVGEFDVRHANGTMRTIDIVGSRIPPDDGGRRAVLNSRDITERRHALEALRLRDEQLRQAQKMEAVGRLAGGIAHDFSNVLTVIISASERLYDRVGDRRDAVSDIESILRNSERAASLTRQLLAFSRQQTLAAQPLDLGQLVRRAGRLLKRLIGEDIVLALDFPDEMLAIEADPTQVEQVLMNLAINARDAMPEGGSLRIALRRVSIDAEFARNHPPMAPGNYVLLEVEDSGTGMTPETAAHAFEPFFTTKHPSKGTGLGLSTVYGIVKQSGGFIWIDTEPGRGTTFSIFLPPTSARPVPRETPKRQVIEERTPATILLAEDEDEVRSLLRDVLEMQGHTVLEANGPVQGVEVAAAYPGTIDLLLTDVVMPGGTGRDLAREIVARRPETKVLYMSGYPDAGGSPQGVLEPGVPFLSKPFTRDVLLAKVHELLGHSRIHHS
jgi:two-component system, cell cycle sensor histidine kinase and response regulator CckA